MADKDLRVNKMIRVREVRLIDDDGQQRGIISTVEALETAKKAGLDLVEVAPMARPPVCRLLDYGKFKFEQEKKNRESKKRQKTVKLKEIRMQPKIDVHDLKFKAKHVQEFLGEGYKVKVTIRFRGRELAHTELGRDVLDRVIERLQGSEDDEAAPTSVPFVVERGAHMEGRFMSMFLSPKSKK